MTKGFTEKIALADAWLSRSGNAAAKAGAADGGGVGRLVPYFCARITKSAKSTAPS